MVPAKNPPVQIIILNYNSFNDTIECVKSIIKNEIKTPYQLTIIDNGSNNFDEKKINKISTNIQIIKSKTNLGYAGGINLGIRSILSTNTDHILLLNNDTIVEKNFLTELVNTASQNSSIGIVGPLITYYSNPGLIWFAGGLFNKYTTLTRHKDMNKDKQKYANTTPFETKFISGCCMLIKTDLLKKIGLFDKSYFLYNEDLDFCYKTAQEGYIMLINPKSEIRHKISASSSDQKNTTCDPHQFSKTKAYYWSRSDMIFIKKNLKGVPRLTATISIFLIKYPYFILYLLSQKKYPELKEYFRGILGGIKYKIF